MNRLITLSLKNNIKLSKRNFADPTNNTEMLPHQVNNCTKLMVEAKDKHLAKLSSKLDIPNTALKTYWSVINRCLNNKKIPIIPSVFFKGKLMSDFQKKAKLFNNHFASQCSLVKNASTLPNLEYKTDE